MNPPEKPDESDCCGSGCSPCILDIYDQQLKAYEKYLLNNSSGAAVYENCLSQTTYSNFNLIKIIEQTTNIRFLTFESNLNVFYNPSQHFLLKNEEMQFTRAYTPIPMNNSPNQFSILIKLYENGKMSKYISNLKIGDMTKWRGPYGNFKINYSFDYILCISQGVGIAPIYGIIKNILDNENCETRVVLKACFKNLDEFSLRRELHELKQFWNFTSEFYLPYELSIDNLLYNEVIRNRHLQEKDIKEFLVSKENSKIQVLVCGTNLFNEKIKQFLKMYDKIEIYVF